MGYSKRPHDRRLVLFVLGVTLRATRPCSGGCNMTMCTMHKSPTGPQVAPYCTGSTFFYRKRPHDRRLVLFVLGVTLRANRTCNGGCNMTMCTMHKSPTRPQVAPYCTGSTLFY